MSCHEDIHRGQFQEGGVTRCERCHGSTGRWVADRFDHNRDSRFPSRGSCQGPVSGLSSFFCFTGWNTRGKIPAIGDPM